MKKPKSIVRSPKREEENTSTAMPDPNSLEVRFKQFAPPPDLELDIDSFKPQQTRSEHYSKLESDSVRKLEDVVTPAGVMARCLAGGIDLLLVLLCGYFLLKEVPQLDVKMFELPLKNTLLSWYLLYVIAAFFVHVLPLALFQTTVGKKIMKIKVRGLRMYSINISQIVFRELIVKPLSYVLVIGIMTSGQQRTLHDKLTGTQVIAD